MKFTNHSNIDMSVAVWLASDTYDLQYRPDVISATNLLDPIKSIVLTRQMRTSEEEGSIDIADQVASKVGSAVHTAVEEAWIHHYKTALTNLGYPESIVERIRINPKTEKEGEIPIYLEQRSAKKVGDYLVSGKFDLVIDGTVMDIKTTKTYNWIKGGNNEKYQMQGSIYRWLNPDIIKSPYMFIQYMFTDWSELKALADKKYPQHRVMAKKLPLLTEEQIQDFIETKLTKIDELSTMAQENMPNCTPKEMWQNPSKWAYYKNPGNTNKATRVLDLKADADLMNAQNGGGGLVVERPAETKFCLYCNARSICLQAERNALAGLIKIPNIIYKS